MKKIILMVVSLLLILSFVGCSSALEKGEKTFSQDGIEITLTKGFKQKEVSGYTLCFDSADVAVFVLKESFNEFVGKDIPNTVEEYAEIVRASNHDKQPSEITNIDGLVTMEYSFHNSENGTTYKYLSVMFKGSDAFYLVSFATDINKYENAKPHFIDYAKSVKVK